MPNEHILTWSHSGLTEPPQLTAVPPLPWLLSSKLLPGPATWGILSGGNHMAGPGGPGRPATESFPSFSNNAKF